jgi:pimeloyl-CoA synthetase
VSAKTRPGTLINQTTSANIKIQHAQVNSNLAVINDLCISTKKVKGMREAAALAEQAAAEAEEEMKEAAMFEAMKVCMRTFL